MAFLPLRKTPEALKEKIDYTCANKMTAALNGLISVIIPALNEEFGIQKTISSIPVTEIRDTLGYNVEILVIDGNSTDLTRDAARKAGAQVIVEKQPGYGRAYKTGFAAAKGHIIITLDADNTYPAELIPKYLKQIYEYNADFITINRFANMEEGSMSFTRQTGNKMLALLISLLYSISIKDSQSGMWLMKKTFLSKIHLKSDDMSMSEEIKIIAFKFFSSLEVDGVYRKRTGAAKLNIIQHGWKNMKYLFEYRKYLGSAVQPLILGNEEIHLPSHTKP
jgi:dolichol-phosphate hexosyltransferase